MEGAEMTKPTGHPARNLAGASLMLAALALSACQDQPASAPEQQSAEPSEPSGASSELEIQPMSSDDLFDVEMDGELGCAFAADPAEDPLLIASGFVGAEEGHADMVIKFDGALVHGRAREAGGFDTLVNGSAFDTAGMTIAVTRTADEPAGEGESPPYPAMMQVTVSGGDETDVQGFWTCGP